MIRFVLRDGRICENDARLVWTSVQSLIRHTKAGRFVDEMVWPESESADLTMSIAGRLKNAGLAEVLAWLKSGEASKVIEIGIEFVRNHRAKAIEIDLLAGKFYRLHPEHIRSLAQQHGVDPSYVEQMRAYGVDVENWPMSVIPTCPVKTGPPAGRLHHRACGGAAPDPDTLGMDHPAGRFGRFHQARWRRHRRRQHL